MVFLWFPHVPMIFAVIFLSDFHGGYPGGHEVMSPYGQVETPGPATSAGEESGLPLGPNPRVSSATWLENPLEIGVSLGFQ